MVCDLKVEKAITENLKVGLMRIVLHWLTHLFIQSAKEETGSGATGSGTNLSIPIICYRLLPTEQQGSPLPSSLFPLCRVASLHALIKTTGGIRNAAWLLPACNRHHLVHTRVGGVLSPFPSPPLRLKHQSCGSLIGPQRAPEQKAILSTVLRIVRQHKA